MRGLERLADLREKLEQGTQQRESEVEEPHREPAEPSTRA